ncbi:hypothetical protein J120_00935 [candidate division TM6 bacterium JCVI TM6SC1]|uniref:ABC-2 type transporter domain-containing protein n=1 Tax=candidate division TM6 bacterium JCVI TM6SC1 TaxID=1306947 RepID=A0A0D2K5J8_9BACT|nr:hypothetical protein J120_00935 [candidate division TM6 bacterium JCVI TM6SC1]
MNTFIELSNIRVLYALISKDLYVMRTKMKDICINGIVLTLCQTALFGIFFPQIGMPEKLVASIYLGTVTNLIFSLNNALAVRILFDVHRVHFIEYQMVLSINTMWLLASYILSMMIEIILSSIPSIVFGFLLLQSYIDLYAIRIIPFIGIYLLSLACLSTFFLSMCIRYPFTWYLDNIWPRRFLLLINCGCVFFPWFNVYNVSPTLGYLLLCNPVTYISEGLRAAALPHTQTLPLWICAAVLLSLMPFLILLLYKSAQKQLDPVFEQGKL